MRGGCGEKEQRTDASKHGVRTGGRMEGERKRRNSDMCTHSTLQHTPAHSSTLHARAAAPAIGAFLPGLCPSVLSSLTLRRAVSICHLAPISFFLFAFSASPCLAHPFLSLPFSLSLSASLSPPTSNSPSAHLDSMATPPDTRPSTPGTPMTSTARDVFEFDERLFSAAGDLDKQTSPPSNSKQELFVFQWLATVERELKRCGHVGFPRRFKRTDYLCRMTWKLINLSLVVVGYFSHNATKPGEAAAQVNINAGSKAASSHQEAHRSLLSLALCPRKLFHFVRNNSNLAKSHRGRKGHGR